MDLRKNPQRPITKPKQLLVEGRTPFLFFEVLTAHLGIVEIEMHDFGGNEQLGPFLKAFGARPEFKEKVQSLAIVRDAEFTLRPGQIETNPQTVSQAFASLCAHLTSAGLPAPTAPAAFTTTTPKVGVFILPNCCDPGMLETLCLE